MRLSGWFPWLSRSLDGPSDTHAPPMFPKETLMLEMERRCPDTARERGYLPRHQGWKLAMTPGLYGYDLRIYKAMRLLIPRRRHHLLHHCQDTESKSLNTHSITMKSTLSLAALSLAISHVSAHYIFDQLSVGSTKYAVYQYIRQNTNYNSPVTDLTSNDLRCNVGGESGASTATVGVTAGSQITFTLDTPVYHQGPISV
jgi:hypothetical protein